MICSYVHYAILLILTRFQFIHLNSYIHLYTGDCVFTGVTEDIVFSLVLYWMVNHKFTIIIFWIQKFFSTNSINECRSCWLNYHHCIDTNGKYGEQYESWIIVRRGHHWLNCVSHKSGIPMWILSSILFLSSFFLLWLCCAATLSSSSSKKSCRKPKKVKKIIYNFCTYSKYSCCGDIFSCSKSCIIYFINFSCSHRHSLSENFCLNEKQKMTYLCWALMRMRHRLAHCHLNK